MRHRNQQLFASVMLSLLGLFVAASALGQARELVEPDVMLLIDSSGSMDWRDNTGKDKGAWDWARDACEADAFDQASRTSWQKMQDAFLGKFNQSTYRCAVEYPVQRPGLHALRDEDDISQFIPTNISEFDDVTYPHFRSLSCSDEMWQGDDSGYQQCIDNGDASLTILADGITRCYNNDDNLYNDGSRDWCLNLHPEADPRHNNGILDSFGANVRFGAMTYDNLPKCWEDCDTNRHATRWDYGHYRHWNCGGIDDNVSTSGIGNICYDWNAGARGNYDGAVGGLVGIGMDAESSNDSVGDLLESMEPLFCSPLGALIDDAGYYFANDPMVLPVSDFNGGIGLDPYYRCRAKIAVLISDGQPTSVFEFPAGTCTGSNNDLSEWNPVNSAVADRVTHENPNGPSFGGGSSALLDEHIFDCPWRSSPEEAAELFDVGAMALGDFVSNVSSDCTPPECWPLLTVVVGFNVPDNDTIDCTLTPDACYWYDPEKYTPCWGGLPSCSGGDADAGVDEEVYCPMKPREFLNEIACQGWPYQPAVSQSNNYGGESIAHETAFAPPWLDDYCEEGSDLCDVVAGGHKERALFVENVDDMAAILDLILVEMTSNVVTRTDLVSFNAPSVTGFTSADVGQYEFQSGYLAKAGRPWQGVLTRTDHTCSEDTADTKHNISELILNQGVNRKIYSYTEAEDNQGPGTDISNWVNTNTNIATDLDTLTASQFDDCAFGVGEYIGASSDTVCNGRNDIADIIREETLSRGLADIFNSTPAVLGPPGDRVTAASYQLYRAGGNSGRSPFIFVATNDGVLHAINNDDIASEDGASPEAWGFIPKSLLKELRTIYPIPRIRITKDSTTNEVSGYSLDPNTGTGLYRHLFLLDGAPVARDVLLVRKVTEIDQTVEANAWRAVVFGSSGKNARTLYALDVTDSLKDPDEAPDVRYEIAPDHGMYANNEPNDDGDYDLDELGMPVSKPALAYVRQTLGEDDTADRVVVGAAIVPGGYKADPDPNAPDPKQAGNTGLYVIRLVDGQVIRYLDPQDDICDGGVGLIQDSGTDRYWDGAQMIGEPVVPHGTRSLQVTTHAYIGDDRGRLWLIDMYDEDPDNWCLSVFFDSLIGWHYPYEDCLDDSGTTQCTLDPNCISQDCCTRNDEQLPCGENLARNMIAPRAMVIGAPSISLNEDNEEVIIFGTGQYDELTSWNRNRIFSLTVKSETTRDDTTNLLSVRYEPEINWWVGEPVPSGGGIFDDIPGSAGTEKAFLQAIHAAMGGDSETRFAPDTFPGDAYAPDQLTDRVDGLGPNEFWNVGEKLIGRPVVFDQVAYFTTYVPVNDRTSTNDGCDGGASRVWALDYDTFDPDTTASSPNYIGKFTDESGDDTVQLPFHNFYNMVLSGVKVVKKPRCGPSDEGLFELMVQKANPTADTTTNGAPNTDLIDSLSIPINTRSDTSLVSVRFDSWSIVF